MIDKAIVILPAKPESALHSDLIAPLDYVGGITAIQRTLYNLQWAGISEGVVVAYGPWPEVEKKLQEDEKNRAFKWITLPDIEKDGPDETLLKSVLAEPFLMHFPGWIIDRNVIKELLGSEARGETNAGKTLLVEPEHAGPCSNGLFPPLALVTEKDGANLTRPLLDGESPEVLREYIITRTENDVRSMSEPGLIRLQKKEDRERAEHLLLQGLIKPTESLLSKKFERRISLAISRRLLYTGVTPNQISVGSICIGLASALLFLPGSHLSHVAGGILLLLSSIVDGCDGELARLKYQESRWGSWLDFLGDNLVHMAVFFCIGFGLYSHGAGVHYLWLGALGALSTLAAASLVFVRVILASRSAVITFATPFRGEEMDQAGEKLRKKIDLADKISNRDFIYLILALSAIGQLWIFTWFSGVGSTFYLLYLLYLYKRMGIIGGKKTATQ